MAVKIVQIEIYETVLFDALLQSLFPSNFKAKINKKDTSRGTWLKSWFL